MHVWLRLKFMIKTLIAEKEHHCVKWYHRQLCETAIERYESLKVQAHERMGRYFSSHSDDQDMHHHLLSLQDQSLSLTGVPLWFPSSKVNHRRVVEAPYHFLEVHLWDEAIDEMCSLESVCATSLAGNLHTSLRYLVRIHSTLLSSSSSNSVDVMRNERLDHYLRWIQKGCSRLIAHPRTVIPTSACEEPPNSIVKKDFQQLYTSMQGMYSESKVWKETISSWYVGLTLSGKQTFGRLALDLQNTHTELQVNEVCWNPIDSGKIVSCSSDKTLKIWDSETGELIKTLEGHTQEVHSVSWSYDGEWIASGSQDHTAKVWNVQTGEVVRTIMGHCSPVERVRWNPDGRKYLATGCSEEHSIVVWDLEVTDSPIFSFEKVESHHCYFTWNPQNGSLIAATVNAKTIQIWNIETKELLKTLKATDDESMREYFNAIDWSPNGLKMVCTLEGGSFKVWNLETEEDKGFRIKSYADYYPPVIWSPDSLYLAGGADVTKISLFDASTGQLLDVLEDHVNYMISISWSHCGKKLVSCGYDNSVKIWNMSNIQQITRRVDHREWVVDVCWNPVGTKVVTCSNDKTIKIWDVETLSIDRTFCERDYEFSFVSWSPDGSMIAASRGLFDSVTGELLMSYKHSIDMEAIVWAPDSKHFAGIHQYVVKVYRTERENSQQAQENVLLIALVGDRDKITALAWSCDGELLAASLQGENAIRIWNMKNDLAEEQQVKVFKNLEVRSTASFLAWNPLTPHDNILSLSGHDFCLWNILSGENLLEFSAAQAPATISSISWSVEGKRLAVGHEDGTITVWNPLSGDFLITLYGHLDSGLAGVCSVMWSPDGKILASGAEDKTVKIWKCYDVLEK
jgi:WD40 repeat protein